MAGKFEIYQDKSGDYRFRLKASNGEIVLTGQGYQSKAACVNGTESVTRNCEDASRFEKKDSSSGKPYFVLKAANHQVIGQSQMYASVASRDNGIASIARAAIGAKTVDAES